jgi:DNA-binding NtrC family response regulator
MRCLVIRGEDEVLRFPVPEADARLGSDPSNDLIVPIAGVSRFHARVVPDPVAPRLFDLESKNGLIVNGKRVREVALLPGLAVLAGAARITLEDGSTSDFDLALEFPRVTPGSPRPTPDSPPITETVSSSPEARDALRLLRDLARSGEEGRPGPETGELLERLRRVLGARTVALLRYATSGYTVVLACGDPPRESLLAAVVARAELGGTRFVDIDGTAGAWCPPASSGALAALVLLPEGSAFAPWQKEFLEFSLEHLSDTRRALAREIAASAPRKPPLVFPDGMVPGSSPAMRGLLGQIARTVHSRIDVLVLGETGTGKELIARTIHASGPSPDGPFVAINCAAIPSELLESELFGVRARVATGVDAQPGRILEANGGTLLLDEIGELPLTLQPKLLRFLQEREVHSVGASRPEKVNVRVVSISNRDLQADVKAGRFRADLYYRLRGLHFHVPPLSDRKQDIADLVGAFVKRAAAEEGKWVRGVSRRAIDLLQTHRWPGNIRELKAEVHRAVLFCPDGGTLGVEHFGTVLWQVERSRCIGPSAGWKTGGAVARPQHLSAAGRPEECRGEGASSGGDSMGLVDFVNRSDVLTLRERLESVEREAIREALISTGGKRADAARRLGLSRQGLLLKLKRLFPGRGESGPLQG